jgi:hypothetical protein
MSAVVSTVCVLDSSIKARGCSLWSREVWESSALSNYVHHSDAIAVEAALARSVLRQCDTDNHVPVVGYRNDEKGSCSGDRFRPEPGIFGSIADTHEFA